MVLSLFPCELLRYIFSYLCGRSRLGFFKKKTQQVLLKNFSIHSKRENVIWVNLGKTLELHPSLHYAYVG